MTFTNKQHLISSIEDAHWPDIIAIQNAAFQNLLPEAESVLRSKAAASPKTCLVMPVPNSESPVRIAGYALAHPWPRYAMPKLHQLMPDPAFFASSKNLYLHDLAVSSTFQGCGCASALFERVYQLALVHGFSTLSLVAVQGSVSLWEKCGMKLVADCPVDAAYGEGAVFMEAHVVR